MAEAKEATKRLGITNSSQYSRRFKEDPRLPYSPPKTYEGWVDWYEFCDKERPVTKYQTIGEAAAAARALGISSMKEFSTRYREDPRLPSNPGHVYRGKGWSGFQNFIEETGPDESSP